MDIIKIQDLDIDSKKNKNNLILEKDDLKNNKENDLIEKDNLLLNNKKQIEKGFIFFQKKIFI